MSPEPTKLPLLDADSAAFLNSPVNSVNVATRDAGNVPAVARAQGCRVSDDRRRVTLLFPPSRSTDVLRNLRANGALAMAMTRPLTAQALQLKGTVARIEPATPEQRASVEPYRLAFAAELESLGYGREFARGVVPPLEDECIAVTFTPTAVFVATPGPNAGRKLGAES